MSTVLPAVTPGELIALGAVWPPVCAAALGLRFYVRKIQGKGLGTDDWLIVPAFVLVVGMAADILTGVGLHSVGYSTPKAANSAAAKTSTSFQQETTNRVLWSFELMQILALGLVKLSVLFFYRRIFYTGTRTMFSILNVLMMFVVGLWMSGFFISWIFICRADPAAYWISSATEAQYCVDTGMLHNAYAVSDFVTDTLILLLPIAPVLRLHLTTGRKIALVGIFMLGALTVAASCTRMVIYQKATAAKFHPGSHVDIDLTASISMYWSMLESGLGFCAACLPTIYTIVKSKSLQSIVRSVGSMMSIHSDRSQGREGPKQPKSSPINTAGNTSWSKISEEQTLRSISTTDASAKQGVESIELEPMPPHDRIHMTQTYTVEGESAV